MPSVEKFLTGGLAMAKPHPAFVFLSNPKGKLHDLSLEYRQLAEE